MLVISISEKPRQEDDQFDAHLGCIIRSYFKTKLKGEKASQLTNQLNQKQPVVCCFPKAFTLKIMCKNRLCPQRNPNNFQICNFQKCVVLKQQSIPAFLGCYHHLQSDTFHVWHTMMVFVVFLSTQVHYCVVIVFKNWCPVWWVIPVCSAFMKNSFSLKIDWGLDGVLYHQPGLQSKTCF